MVLLCYEINMNVFQNYITQNTNIEAIEENDVVEQTEHGFIALVVIDRNRNGQDKRSTRKKVPLGVHNIIIVQNDLKSKVRCGEQKTWKK